MKKHINLILAALFMMGFLMFWESFVMSRYGARPPKTPPTPAPVARMETEKLSPAEFSKSVQDVSNSKEEVLTILESPDAKVSLLSRGARVVSWQVRERDHWIELIGSEKRRLISPLQTFPEVNFQSVQMSPTQASFQASLPNGILIKKDIHLLSKPPFHAVEIVFSNPTKSAQSVETSLPLGNGIDKHEVGHPYNGKDRGAEAETSAIGLAGRVKRWKPGFIFSRTINVIDQEAFRWIGVGNNHFLSALFPLEGLLTSVRVVADRQYPPMVDVPLVLTLQPGEMVKKSFHLYMGPKNYNDLKNFNVGLEESVDFGFFGVIAKFLLSALNFFHSLTDNYGWAIILLTFCLQILMFPLTRKNLAHAAKMRELQPQIKKLQEQYKSDPKRLQVETFNFYKKNGMKFMGMEGCFPMLLQIPVFFAFYSTLNVAYELRGAPWIFWIKDLGVYDPYFVLPILMGVGMLVQQKMTAVPTDPAQAKMMMFMPIIFTVRCFKLPAGLVLYWCVNSATTIALQSILGAAKHTHPQPS